MRRALPFLPVLAGLAAAGGQAPWGLWYVALPGFALGIWALARATRPFLAGWIFGAAYFGLALHWIVEPFFIDAAATAWLAPVALLATAFGFGLFWAIAAWAARRLQAGPLGVALALAAAELTRSYIFTGFPWALPGHILIDTPALPAASILGAHGLGLFVLMGAALVALPDWRGRALGLVLWVLPAGLGALLPPAPIATADAPVLRLVQPNAPQHLKWHPDHIYDFFEQGLAETAAPPAGRAPDAVIWPETALPDLLRYTDDIRPMIARAAGGKPVVSGAQRYDDEGRPRNALVLLTGVGGDVALVHDKHRLVPFGEFLPLPGVFGALGIGPLASQLAGRYAPGSGPLLIDVPGIGSVLPMICYEAIFPQDIRRVARPRAILHLTNDAWFGDAAGPQQHLALARLRAAEAGLPLFRAANTGISAAIDARGQVLASLPLSVSGHLDARLPPALPATIYVRTGDWAAFAIMVMLFAGLGLLSTRKSVAGRGEDL